MLSRAEQQAQLEELDRKWGLESLYYMAKFNLGYDEMQDFPHKEVCGFAQSVLEEFKRGLDMEPRGAFKTTIFSQALPVFAITRNPNIRILLDSVVLQNSIDNLGVIKEHFESEKFKFLYGDFVGQKKWTAEEVTVKKRTARGLKEPTVRCASTEKVQVGPHYDLIICDDLVSKENIETPEQRKKVSDHFRLLFSLLEPEGVIVAIGTHWHYMDLYHTIQEEMGDEFAIRIMSAETSGKDGGLYFPQRLPQSFLDGQKKKLGRDHYSAQYLNDPAPEDEHSKFRKATFKRYRDLPERRYAFINVDPGGREKGNDDWCFFTAYNDDKNEFYFDKEHHSVYKLSAAWDFLFNLVEQVDPICVGFETTGQQGHMLDSLYDEMRRRNKFFVVQELKHSRQSKATRIENLIPLYEAGAIHHSSYMGTLEDQLRRFPKGADDVADAASGILEIAIAPRKARPSKPEIRSIDDFVWQQVKRQGKIRQVHTMLGDQG